MEHLSNDHEGHPNQHENSHKQCDEIGHPISSLLDGQWKVLEGDNNTFSSIAQDVRESNRSI